MARKILISFNDYNIEFNANLVYKDDPEMCELFWSHLEKPLKFYCYHTLLNEQVFLGFRRPPLHPIKTGSRTEFYTNAELKKSTEMLSGIIQYTGVDMRFLYGDSNIGPISCGGSIVASVDKKDLSLLKKAGEIIWEAQKSLLDKRMVTYIVTRKEN